MLDVDKFFIEGNRMYLHSPIAISLSSLTAKFANAATDSTRTASGDSIVNRINGLIPPFSAIVALLSEFTPKFLYAFEK